MKQKRMTAGMIQASDLRSNSASSKNAKRITSGVGGRKEMHCNYYNQIISS